MASNSEIATYSITCQCGNVIAIKITQAGGTVTCVCGAVNQVPRMSELRRSAGETPVPLSLLERVEQMIRSGSLPEGNRCVMSGAATQDVFHFHVQCEQPWVRSQPMGSRMAVAMTFLLGWIGALIALSSMQNRREEFGRDISIIVPVPLDAAVLGKDTLAKMNQRKLRQLLSQVPIYQRLLEEYPRAIISPVGSRLSR